MRVSGRFEGGEYIWWKVEWEEWEEWEERTEGGVWREGRTSFICTMVSRIAVCIVEEEGAEEGGYAEYS